VTEGADFGYGAGEVPGLALPAVWIPHDQDTSSASPLWLRGSAFEAWEGGVLHLSYGTGALFLGRPGAGWPARQGAVLPLGIRTGLPLLHARVRPGEGSVWLAGFRIYDSGAPALEGIGRLRPSGEPLAEAVDATIVREGVVLKFAAELDPASVTADAVRAKQWQYRRSAAYGSPRLKSDGKSQGTEAVATGAVFLSKDGRSVFLHIPGLAPVMQLELSHRFRVKGGKDEPRSVFLTVAATEPSDWAALGFEAPALDASVAAVRGGGATVAASAEHGKEVAVRYGCIACHSVDGTLEGHSGPSWKGLYGAERKFLNGKPARIADDAYLSDAILEPAKEIVEGYALGMGSYAGVLDEAELKSILLYIRSLK
jgi:cytochrome c551/c552